MPDQPNIPEAATPSVGGFSDSSQITVMKKRADFLRTAQGRRKATPAFVVQARKRNGDNAGCADIRVGFTCSKKVGNAVQRNKAKRRLRALVQSVLPATGRPGWDYVLIGRREVTAVYPFDAMSRDMRHALKQLHGAPSTPA